MAVPVEAFLTLNVANLLVTLVIPFLLFFTVLLVAIKNTRIFGNNNWIYIILSLGLTILLYVINPNHVFEFIASYLVQIGVAGTVISLTGLIVIIFWALIRRGVDVAKALRGDEQKLKDLEREERKLLDKYYRGGLFGTSTGKRIQLTDKLKQIEQEKKYLLARLKKVQTY